MIQLTKRVGKVELETWLNGHPRWTKLRFDDQELRSLQPEDLRDLQYAIDRFLAQIDEHDSKGRGSI